MSDFLFNTDIPDKSHSVRVSITRCDADDEDIQIIIKPYDKYTSFPSTTLFLSLAAARDLGEALTAAADAEAVAEDEPDPDLLREIRDERLALLAALPSEENEHG